MLFKGISPKVFDPQTRIGDWSLPFLTIIYLIFEAVSRITIGRFEECSCLETLSVRIGQKETPSESLTNQCTCRPVWNMSRLKSLILKSKAAIIFNFDSLDSMLALERFGLTCLSERPISLESVPRLSAYRCHPQAKNSGGNIPASDPATSIWKDHWHLLHLTGIRLEGLQSSVYASSGWSAAHHSSLSIW